MSLGSSTPTRRGCSRPAGRGRCPGAGGGQLSATPDAVRVSASAPGGFPGAVRGGGPSGAGVGSGALLSISANASKRKAMSYAGCRQRNSAWKARSRRCCVRRMRLTRPRTRAWARRFGAMIFRRSCVGGKSVWRRSGKRRRVPLRSEPAPLPHASALFPRPQPSARPITPARIHVIQFPHVEIPTAATFRHVGHLGGAEVHARRRRPSAPLRQLELENGNRKHHDEQTTKNQAMRPTPDKALSAAFFRSAAPCSASTTLAARVASLENVTHLPQKDRTRFQRMP